MLRWWSGKPGSGGRISLRFLPVPVQRCIGGPFFDPYQDRFCQLLHSPRALVLPVGKLGKGKTRRRLNGTALQFFSRFGRNPEPLLWVDVWDFDGEPVIHIHISSSPKGQSTAGDIKSEWIPVWPVSIKACVQCRRMTVSVVSVMPKSVKRH